METESRTLQTPSKANTEAIIYRANEERRKARQIRHVTWMLLLMLLLVPLAMHAGGIAAWVAHTNASYQHQWQQVGAYYKQMQTLLHQLHKHQ